jgi:hypothetical protein
MVGSCWLFRVSVLTRISLPLRITEAVAIAFTSIVAPFAKGSSTACAQRV